MRSVLFLLAALGAGPALAAPPPARLGLCAACHGADGRGRIALAPNLAGQRYEYLLHALHDYRSGRRDAAVMRTATGPLSESELEQLAHWYADLPVCAPTRPAAQ